MDERFPVDSDPRFIRPKKRERVVLDARFSSILDPEFSEQPLFDRYGNKRRRKKDNIKKIKSLYVLPEGFLEKASFSKKNKKSSQKKITDDEDKEITVDSSEALSQGEGEAHELSVLSSDELSSEDELSDDSSSSFISEELDLVDPDPEEEIPRGKMTHRLAAVNLDWDHIRSVDIFAALSSFVPKEGRILSVRVYPSEFGKKKMEKEDIEGPPREIFSKSQSIQKFNAASENEQLFSSVQNDFDKLESLEKFEKHVVSSSNEDHGNMDAYSESLDLSDHSDTQDNVSNDDDEKIKQELLKEDDGNDFNMTELRKYQLQRLRYYYAIVTCDSLNTAKHIYEQCDGREYEASANFFDLRFVPDEESFDSMEVRDECLFLPENYVPDNFVTDALKHSKVKLMWDNDDPVYTQIVKRAFSGKDIDENDFKAYLASTDSEASDVETTKKRYRSLLLENEKEFSNDKNSIVGGIQVTFMPGMNDKEVEMSDGNETTLEKYMKKEKERKQKKKEKKLSMGNKYLNDTNNNEKNKSDLGFDDPFFSEKSSVLLKKKKHKTNRKEKQQDNKDDNKAELELLMMDEDMLDKNIDHFDMKEILKMEKKKNKKKTKPVDLEGLQDNFNIDVNDPRFSAIYSSHHFAIDPTNPRFKKTKSMLKIMEERQRRTKTG